MPGVACESIKSYSIPMSKSLSSVGIFACKSTIEIKIASFKTKFQAYKASVSTNILRPFNYAHISFFN